MANRIKLRGTSERQFDIGLTNKQTFDASNLTANRTWILPDSAGNSGQVLSTDGAGNLSWATAIAAAAGSNSQVQYNANGAFAADTSFTYNKGILGGVSTITLGNTAANIAGRVSFEYTTSTYGTSSIDTNGSGFFIRAGNNTSSLQLQGPNSTVANNNANGVSIWAGFPTTAGTGKSGSITLLSTGPTLAKSGNIMFTTFAGNMTLEANGALLVNGSYGNVGQVLTVGASNVVGWANVPGGSGSPGGNTTEIQFNNAGNFGGDPAFTWNATTDVLTVSGDIANVDSLTFDTTATEASAVAKISWDDGYGMLQYGLKGGNYDIKIGEDLATLCYNGTGSTIAKGKIVYIAGAQGQRISVGLADNTLDTTSSKTFGFVAENFPNGEEKFVVTQGMLRNIDTSLYSPGTILWLGKNGNFTSTKPVAPDHLVFVGVVLKQHAVSGEVYVKPQNGYELDEIHDVLITTPVANSSVLQYDSANSLWINQTTAQFRTSANIGNIANINLSGNGSQVLAGNGSWVAAGATVDDCIVFAIALS